MNETLAIVIRLLQSALGSYGALYLISAIFYPGWFLDNLAIIHIDTRAKRKNLFSDSPWYSAPMVFLTWIALGVIFYAATYAIIAFVPYSWGGENDDGVWEGARQSIQYIIAFIAPIGFVERLEANAETIVCEPLERVAREALQQAIRRATGTCPEVRQSVLVAFAKSETGDAARDTLSVRYEKQLRHWVSASLELTAHERETIERNQEGQLRAERETEDSRAQERRAEKSAVARNQRERGIDSVGA
jgi:hypothetical protein